MVAVLALLVAVVALTTGAGVAMAQGGAWVVRDYDVTITINDDSTVRVVEEIEVDFSAQQRGIFRYWEVVESLPDPLPADSTIEIDGEPSQYQRHIEIDVEDVTSSTNAPTDVELTTESGELRARIGDPDIFITGVQRYRITYTVTGAMNSFEAHDELYWDPVGSWPVEIADLTVLVERPGIDRVACFAGYAGSSDETCPATFDDDGATFDFGRVPPGVYPTIVVGLPPGEVDVATPIVRPVPTFWTTIRDGLWGSLPAAVASALVLVGGLGMLPIAATALTRRSTS